MAKTDTKLLIRRAKLVYGEPDGPGIRRVRRGEKFAYVGVSGRPVNSVSILKRIDALVIPPAWEEVWIASSPKSHIQAVGRDAKGRRQYLYHQEWERVRDETKFHQQSSFGKTLPRLRRRLQWDLALRGLPREKVLACGGA